MEAVQDEGSPPPLDPTLAPVLLFDCGAAGEEASGGGDDDDARFVYSIPTGRSLLARGLRRFVDDDVNWVTPHGWVLTLDPATRGVSLRDPFTSSREVSLPRDVDNVLAGGSGTTKCFLSSSSPTPLLDHQGFVVLVADLTDPVLCYCRPGDSRWFRHEYEPEQIDGEDRDGVIEAMASLTGAGAGKFYAYLSAPSRDVVVTLEFSSHDDDPTLTTTRVVTMPCPSGCCFMRLCVLESCGDLFMVRFCYTRLCDTRIFGVDVQKLDWSRSAWVKAVGLGDNRVFFIRWGQFGASMAADELGLKGNCVYFTVTGDKGLYVHDMERGTTSVHDPGVNVPDSMEPILLIMPVLNPGIDILDSL